LKRLRDLSSRADLCARAHNIADFCSKASQREPTNDNACKRPLYRGFSRLCQKCRILLVIGKRRVYRFQSRGPGFKSLRAHHNRRILKPLARGAVAENDKRDSGRDNTNRRASLVALGVVVVLFVIGWILTRELYSNQKIEDCVLSGRTKCVTIDTNTSSY
jgi:hypothetical protein